MDDNHGLLRFARNDGTAVKNTLAATFISLTLNREKKQTAPSPSGMNHFHAAPLAKC
jgi:hypothetical protein